MSAVRTIAARSACQEARAPPRVPVVGAAHGRVPRRSTGSATWQAFEAVEGEQRAQLAGVEPDVVAGATLLGLNMFGTLFLGTILAVFLTLGAVRGDAERGLLQPLLVRPVPRRTLLLARFAVAPRVVCGAYVIVVLPAPRP